ncbi:nuclear transport factor 2 family protein [Halodesulfovibrio marinisediminis]|uniref:SnoaL-like domain-containing protein n=1 Tax=Halodesulfovibrio marinisediminis DSM 17456 TaxID=1121457 RepID=A0A1N6J8L1_9BACT|nr:nuclear transport factor 2 family protein [Halodesulfovibrio marinisediminis]SIO40571.1 SnoaL-like domain-containing protein [Halodesulfovibrio marinisediminis DSM 17456]
MPTYIERREKTDTALLETLVESLGVLLDLRLFNTLETMLTDEVTVDYTSLFGGEPHTASPKDVIYRWKESLCGFDATRHKLENIRVELKGQEATVKADATAIYFLHEHIWEGKGKYVFGCRFTAEGWKVRSLQFDFKSEKGTRDILEQAWALAEKKGKCDMSK